MYSLKLYFVGSEEPALFQTEFVYGLSKAICVRGKTGGAFTGRGSFHWSSAVRGMCLLAIKTCMASHGYDEDPVIFGEQGSLAASLDYALSKETVWLVEIFGTNDEESPNFRRLFKRTNSGRKRLGPVAVSLSKSLQEKGAIEVILNGSALTAEEEFRGLLSTLQMTAQPLSLGDPADG
jgi:hypothetical protein